mgnify:CR=1 FL=1
MAETAESEVKVDEAFAGAIGDSEKKEEPQEEQK